MSSTGNTSLGWHGPQIRIVWSSLADANILGLLGFQLTQFTVIEWPDKISIGLEFRRFQM